MDDLHPDIDVVGTKVKADAVALRDAAEALLQLHYGWTDKEHPVIPPTDAGLDSKELSQLLCAAAKLVVFVDLRYMPQVDKEVAKIKEQKASFEKAAAEAAEMEAAKVAELAKAAEAAE